RPASNFGPAIAGASLQLGRTQNENGQPIVRRVLLLSTDGECTDLPLCGQSTAKSPICAPDCVTVAPNLPVLDCGQSAAKSFKMSANKAGIVSQLDVVVIGNNVKGKAKADCLAAMGSDDQLGAVLVIDPNDCTDGKASCD